MTNSLPLNKLSNLNRLNKILKSEISKLSDLNVSQNNVEVRAPQVVLVSLAFSGALGGGSHWAADVARGLESSHEFIGLKHTQKRKVIKKLVEIVLKQQLIQGDTLSLLITGSSWGADPAMRMANQETLTKKLKNALRKEGKNIDINIEIAGLVTIDPVHKPLAPFRKPKLTSDVQKKWVNIYVGNGKRNDYGTFVHKKSFVDKIADLPIPIVNYALTAIPALSQWTFGYLGQDDCMATIGNQMLFQKEAAININTARDYPNISHVEEITMASLARKKMEEHQGIFIGFHKHWFSKKEH